MSFSEWSHSKKKKQDEENRKNNTKTALGNKMSFSDWSDNKLSSRVDKDYINTFISDAKSFLSSAEEDYKNVGWNNASSAYSSKYASWEDLNNRNGIIRIWLDNNKDRLDEETYSSLSSTLDEYDSRSSTVLSVFKDASDRLSQYKTEEDYNKAVKDTEKLEKWADPKHLELLNSQSQAYSNIMGTYNGWDTRKAGTLNKEATKDSGVITYYGKADEDAAIKERDEWFANATKQAFGKAYTYEEFTNTYGGISAEYVQAKRYNEGLKLTNDALSATDFGTFSLPDTAITDNTYKYINDINGYRTSEDAYWTKNATYTNDQGLSFPTMKPGYIDSNYNYMTGEEIGIFNYYYSKFGKEKAYEYLDNLQQTLNTRSAIDIREINDTTFERLFFGVEAGLDQFGSGVKNLFNTSDDYITPSDTQIASGMIREDLADTGKLPEWMGDTSLGQVGYDLINTTSNMLPSILTSTVVGAINPTAGAVVGAGLMGASASGNAYAEMLNLGYDKGQARMYSALVGTSEATLQYLLGGIGKLGGKLSTKALTGVVNNIDNAFARVSIKLGTSMASEFTEEYLQEVLNPFFKNITLGTNEDIRLFSTDALYAGILGALSAGVLEGGSTISTDINTTQMGKQIQSVEGGVQRLKDLGTTFSADTVAYKIADKVTEKTGAYKIGLLLQEVGGNLSEQNVSDITIALTKKGMTETDAKKLAKTYQAFLNNEMSLTDEQIEVLEKCDPLNDVLRNNIIGRSTNVYQRTREYSDLVKLATEMESTAETSPAPRTETPTQTVAPYSQEYIESVAKELEASGMTSEQARIVAEMKLSAPTKVNNSPAENNIAESEYEVSAEGKTLNTKTGDIVNIKKIDSISESGEVNLTLDDGMIVKSSDISFGSEAEALFIANIGKIKLGKKNISTASANALYQIALTAWKTNPKMTASEAMSLIKGLEESYVFGAYNFGRSELTARNEDGSAKRYAGELSQSQRAFAYDLGSQDRVSEVEKDQKVIDELKAKGKPSKKSLGKIIFEKGAEVDESTLTATQKANLNGIKLLADISSVEFHVFRSDKVENTFKYTMPDGTVNSANGWFVAGTNEIWVDLNAGNAGEGTMIRTAAHEISHYIKQWSPKKWQAMADLIMEEFAKNGVDTESMLNRQKAKIKRRYTKNNTPSEEELLDMAFEELVSDALSDMLTDGSIVNFIAEVKVKDASLAKKILNAIKSLLKKWGLIIEDYKDRDLDTDEAKALSQLEDTFKKLQEMYRDAFMDANEVVAKLSNSVNSGAEKSQNNTTVEGDVKFANRQHYWASGFSHNEMSYVERIAKHEVELTDNYIDIENKWLYNNRKGQPYFALYSTAHIDNPTVMYASKGSKATKEYKWFMDFIAEMEMTKNGRDDLRRKTINEVLVSLGYALDKGGLYSRKPTRPRNNRNVGVYSGTPGFKPSEALLNCIKNIGEKQERSEQRGVVRYSDRDTDTAGNDERVHTGDKRESEKQQISFSLLDNTKNTQKNTTDEGDVKLSDRANNYYQEYLDDMPIDEYNKLTVKKPIKVSKDVFAAVNSARTQLYGDAIAEDIPIIDIINLGEYGVLNSDDFYFIRNADRIHFSIIKHTKTLKRRENKHVDIRGRQKGNPTDPGNNNKNGRVGFEGEDNPSNRNNRPSSHKSAFGENANETQFVEETDRRIGTGNSTRDIGRRIVPSDRDSDDSLNHSSDGGVDTVVYTESQYNNFGWVRANDVLSAAEYNSLMSNYTGHKHKDDYFPITRFGETVLHSSQHNDVLMYAKGNIRSPQITKVVKIEADDYTAKVIKEWILENEYKRVQTPYRAVENIYGNEIISINRKRDYASFQEYRAEQEGRGRQSSDTSGGTEQNRGRSIAEGEGAYSGELIYSERDHENNIAKTKIIAPAESEMMFSDRDFSYDELVAKDDLKGVVIDKTQHPKIVNGIIDNNWVVKKAREKCEVLTRKGGVVYYTNVPDIGTNIEITRDGITHGFAKPNDRKNKQSTTNAILNARVAMAIPQILTNSIEVNRSQRGNNPDVPYTHVLIGTVALEDSNGVLEYYAVRSMVQERENQNPILVEADILGKLTSVNAKKIDSPNAWVTTKNGVARTHGEVYAYKIADLLNDVKDIFDNTFSEDVYRRLGTTRTADDFSKNLLFSERDPDSSNRAILANSLESAVKNDIERKKLIEYKTKISKLNADEKRLSQIQKQLFTKNGVDSAKRKELQFEAKQIANRINIYDRQLLNLEATTALKKVLNRDKALAAKRQKQKDAEAMRDYKEKVAKTQRELLDRHKESRKKAVESRYKTAMKHKIQKVVSELNTLLLNGTKKKHVPEELKVVVADVLELFNMDTVGAEERINKLTEELMKAKTPEKIQEISRKIDYIRNLDSRFGDKLSKFKAGYDAIKASADPEISSGFDDVVSNKIAAVANKVGKTPLRYMTPEQLEDVYDVYKMVFAYIRDSNNLFKTHLSETIQSYASRVVGEIRRVGGVHEFTSPRTESAKRFLWNNLKPIYAMEKIGSESLTSLFRDVRTGEDTWAVDVTEAKTFSDSVREKYGFDKWDFNKKYTFKSSTGETFTLTLEQMLSLYAFSKRPQADDHLRIGGFVFDDSITTYKEKENNKKSLLKYKVNTASSHQISKDTLADIVSELESIPGAKDFVDEMQTYLSDVMGAKGNEVSMTLYNVRLFKEKNYFPLKSAKQFMFEKNEVAGEIKLKNSGFTESTVEHANNPIILSNFMDVWANHINDMAMYHSFVVPLENFNRVFNYQTGRKEGMPPVSVKETLQNAYGNPAVEYVRQLLKDLNGGAVTDPRESTAKKLISTFKKAKVLMSASVVIQQPSAVARALALIDEKYFDFNPKLISHKARWEEVKKYAPVAIIKEMGRFDTDIGLSVVDYIKNHKTFMQKTEDVVSRAPAYADELTWVHIWEAVKRETKAKYKELEVGSEKFLQTVGSRFTEIVAKTQVYDSVLSKSPNMRSKTALMNMATAFMAEPTTTINMAEQSLLLWKRGYKGKALKQLKGVGASVILNAALVCIVYAMRDDDEDETYIEKYFGSITSEILDGFNPLTYVPFVKDAMSLLQGYSVERSDMSLISDIVDAMKDFAQIAYSYNEDMTDEEIESFKSDMVETSLKFVDGIAAVFGIPEGNIRRDIKGVINTVKTFMNGFKTSGLSLKNELIESVKDVTPGWGWLPNKQKSDKLYDAIVSGDVAYVDRLKSGYKDDKAYETAVRKALRENDPRIREAAEARIDGNIAEYTRIVKEIKGEGNFVQDTIVASVNAEINALNKGDGSDSYSDSNKVKSMYKINDYFMALDGGDEATAYVVKEDLIETDVANGKDREDAEDSFNSKFTSYIREQYEEGGITDQEAQRILVNYGDKSEDEAASKVQYWSFKQDYPDYDDLSEEAVTKYYDKVEPYGINVDVYYDYSKQRSKCKGVDANGDGKTDSGSVKAEVMRIINSLPISRSQKDALYYLNGWSAKTIYKAPWR